MILTMALNLAPSRPFFLRRETHVRASRGGVCTSLYTTGDEATMALSLALALQSLRNKLVMLTICLMRSLLLHYSQYPFTVGWSDNYL